MMDAACSVYEIEHLYKTYPGQSTPANRDISLEIGAGEIFGFLGDNGAGKSTLVRQMANLIASDSGTIRLLGQDLNRDPLLVARYVGYMPQDGQTLNNLTVGEALFFTAHLRGLSRSDAQAETRRLLETWQLGELRSRPNSQLSGGQKRLLQLAVAMAGSPPILILDEPTNELAPQKRRMVWDQLRKINQEQGVTIIFITHDALEAEKIIQRVGILHAGRLAALGRPAELKARLNEKLRLEVIYQGDQLPGLPANLHPTRLDSSRWIMYLERSQVSPVLSALHLDEIEDFRLYSATLEDLYLTITGAQSAEEVK